jgi:sugar-phosphatase
VTPAAVGGALLTAHPWVAVAAFAAAGLGVATVFPIAFSSAGRHEGTAPGAAIATVAALGYGGGLTGPPLIGFLAEASTLTLALWTLVVLSLVMAALAFLVADKPGARTILFDLDGVLVDSTENIERQWTAFAAEHGLAVAHVLEMAHGRPTLETIRLIAPGPEAEAQAATIEAREATDMNGVYEVEGARRLLQQLPEERWAVVTSGTRPTALARLRQAGLPVPRVLVTADDVVRGKPDPEPYLLAAQRMGAHPAACVVVEDAPAGIAAAKAAGMRTIGLTTSHSAEKLGQADLVVARLSDVEPLL